MIFLNFGRRHRVLHKAAMRGAGRVRPARSPIVQVEGLESRVLLTAAPVITAPKIFGVRPGTPFIFDVTASGDRPMTFSAAGLPAGLVLNPQTGMITGSLANYATYDLTLTATNPSGSNSENFRIVVGDKLSLTPAMGWNSWTIFAGGVTETEVEQQAAAIASSGLINYGWTYVNVDAGWEGGRTADGQPIQGNATTFPDMQGLANYVHSLNLKLGLYTVPQTTGYVGETAGTAGNNIWPDAQQFASWGVDYLKYDGNPPSQSDIEEMSTALQASGRDIIYSVSNFSGLPASQEAFYTQWATNIRAGTDITDEFQSVLAAGIDSMLPWANYSGPGHWADADNLLSGVVRGSTTPHPTNLTQNQQASQMSIWVMDAAPLLMGNDLTQLDPYTLSLLTNPEVLAIDQDPLGIPSQPVNGNTMIQSRPLADGSTALELINVGDSPANVTVNLSDLGLSGPQIARNIWQEQDVGTYSGSYTATVPADGTVLITLRAATAGAPQISGQPINQFADLGQPATFYIGATGAGTLSYQWTKNGVAIPGANSATYTTPATTSTDNGAVFHCVVTNSVGKIISYEADLTVRGKTTFLSDMHYYYGTTGYYSIQMDASVLGTAMNINGVSFAKGIGTHSPSVIDYYLGGQDATFQAQVGLDNNQPGMAIFEVWLDGTQVYNSGVLTAGMNPVPVSVNVQGGQMLQLIVANGGPNNNYDESDWGGASVTSALGQVVLPTLSSFSRNVPYNAPLTFSSADFTANFSDSISGQSLQNIKIASLPVHGTLQLNGTAVSTGQNIAAAQIAGLTYTPSAGYSGSDSFGWNAADQLGYARSSALVTLTDQTPPPPTALPLVPSASASALSTSSILLTWNDPTVTPNLPLNYTVLTSTDGVHFNQVATVSGAATSLTINNLAAGTTYFYEVEGTNALGNSPLSNAASAVTQTPPSSAASAPTAFDLSGGFTSAGSAMTFNGNARINGSFISLTDNQSSERSSAYYNTPQNITNFTAQFDFEISGTWPLGDGFTFVIQNSGLNAMGQGGGGLGYGASSTGGTGGIAQSVAVKFDVYSNQGEGTNSTGLYINGAAPTTVGSIDLGNTSFNMRSYDLSRATLTYDGTTLTVVLKDLTTGATATQQYAVNIPAIVGGTQAYVGFTAAAGSIYSYQSITDWKFSGSSPSATAPAAPTGLKAIPLAGQAAVSWTALAGASSYTLQYAPTSGGPFTTISGINGTAYTVPGLASGATYYFALSATNLSGTGVYSPQVSATLTPAAPTGLTTVPSNGQVTLNWAGSAGATSYTAKYATVSGGPYTTIAGIGGTSTTITGLTNGVTYYFAVSASNAGGEGANSVESSAMPVLPIPAAPAGLNVTPGNGQVAVAWSAAAFAATYTIKYGTSLGTYTSSVTGIAGTSATVTGLAAGTTYYFVVSASNASGESANSAPGSALLVPGAPAIFSLAGGSGQVALSWTAMAGAASYTVKYATSSGGPYANVAAGISGTSKTITGLAAGTTYYFVVSASNASGEGGNSAEVAAIVAPPAPSGLSVTSGDGQAVLTWNAALGAASYTVKYATTSGGPYTLTQAAGGTSATVTGLSDGTAYYFVVSATNSSGESANSPQALATPAVGPPGAPSNLNATAGSGQAALTWNAVAGASSYTISYGTASGGPYTLTQTSAAASATVVGLASGTTYYFVVSASNGSGTGGNSAQASATTLPAAPGVPSGLTIAPGNGQAVLSWGAVAGAASYDIKYGTASGGPYGSTLSFSAAGGTVTGLTNGTAYYFVVTALNAGGESASSAQVSATPVAVLPTSLNYSGGFATAGSSLQLNGSAQLNGGNLILTSNAQSQLSSVYAKTQQNIAAFSTQFDFQTTGSWPLGDGFTFVIQNSGLNAIGQGGGGLGYGASATGGSGGIANSVAIKFDVFDNQGEGTNSTGLYVNGAAPTNVGAVGLDGTGFNMRSYDLSRAIFTYDGTTLTVVLKDLVTGATATQAYAVNIPAIIGGGTAWVGFTASDGALTSSQQIVNWTFASSGAAPSAPATPTGLAATPGNGQVGLSWNAVPGASSYNVKYSASSGGPYTIASVAGTGTTISGLTDGTPYYFVVSAVSSSGESANSGQIIATPVLPAPATPTGLFASGGNGQVALAWNGINGAASYTVQYGTTSGGPYTTTLAGITTAGATVSGLSNGTAYYFIVTAVNGSGSSAASAQASATPQASLPAAPTGLATAASNTQAALSWNAVAGATSYNVKVATVSGGPYTTLATGVTALSANITGLNNGTIYYFVVSAVNAVGEGANSNQASATPSAPVLPVPVRPSALIATAGNGSVTLNWSTISGATSYNVRYGTTTGGPYTTTLTGLTATTLSIPGLTNGMTYYFVVSAVNASGESANSTEASATPAVPGVAVTTLDFSNGFASAGSALAINGSAYINAGQLRLTDNNSSELSSVYAAAPQNITSFTTQFDFQISGSWPLAEGFTFVIQRAGLSAIGQSGGGLGYGATSTGTGIQNSVAVKFDVFSNQGEGTNSTGLYVNGATPEATGSVDLSGTGFDMRSYDISRALISYDGTTLTVTLTDLRTGATATQKYVVNIPALIGGNTAWVGFTAADGSIVSNQTILNWKYATV